MIKIGIFGYQGRMGQLIAEEIATQKSCQLSGGLVRSLKAKKNQSSIFLTDDVETLIQKSDVLIDFTSASATVDLARQVARQKKTFMTGTTGMTESACDELKKLSKKIALLQAPNTSLSLAAMKQLTTLASKLLANFDYDVSILDEHHRDKKDAPSGTAKALGEAVALGNKGRKSPHYVSLRAGHIIGEHEVIFAGPGETIRLHHSVTDRRLFARGALEAALWLSKKPPGFYTMDDVLKF